MEKQYGYKQRNINKQHGYVEISSSFIQATEMAEIEGTYCALWKRKSLIQDLEHRSGACCKMRYSPHDIKK
jgi:hypothetical protein